jgi:hypothetical protein
MNYERRDKRLGYLPNNLDGVSPGPVPRSHVPVIHPSVRNSSFTHILLSKNDNND